MSATAETVTLKNGEDVPRVAVVTTLMLLQALETENPIALFELRAFCRDPEHNFFPGAAEQLVETTLLSSTGDGSYYVHDVTSAVVLSSVMGESLDIHVSSPYGD